MDKERRFSLLLRIRWIARCVKATVLAAAVVGCARQAPRWMQQQNNGAALGTTYTLSYFTEAEVDYQQEIDSVFRAVNQSLSTYLPTSAIAKINQGDTTVVVDAMFRAVFEISSAVHKASQGYFDPTIGVLANAWGFGPEASVPLDSATVDSLLAYVGWNKVQLNHDNTIRKAHPAIRFDFNAVAKGYAIDRLGALLTAKGIEHYLVEVGGEVRAKGQNLRTQRQWTVGIDDPQAEANRRLKLVVFLHDRALASSGNYRQFWVDPATGERYGHTLNPKTGYPKTSSVLSASVVASSCAVADAYATAFMAMDLEDTQRLLKQQHTLEAYILYLDEEGETQAFITPGFARMVR